MSYSTRLATSVHILLAIYHFENKEKVTSTFLAGSIQTNPVVVRNLFGKLQKSGLTLWDIFLAVEDPQKTIFKPHDDTNPNCEVGRVVHSVLDPRLNDIHNQFLESLKAINLASLITDMDNKLAQN